MQKLSLTPTGGVDKKDEMIWWMDKKGLFTVKSAYFLAQQLSNKTEASTSNTNHLDKDWRKFWKLKAIPKAKIGVWKMINDSIPSKMNIIKKGIQINPLCSFCRSFEESTKHILWECKVVKSIWKQFIPLMFGLFALNRETWTSHDYWSWMMKISRKRTWRRR